MISGGERIIYAELYDAVMAVRLRAGCEPSEIVVLPDGQSYAALGEEARRIAIVSESGWRECVRAHLRGYWGAEPKDWEVERRMRQGARFMGVPVTTENLPAID